MNNPYILEGTEAFTFLITFLLHYDYIFPEIKEFPLYWDFEGNTFVSINILSQLIVTVTSSVRFLYHMGCMNFYPKDCQDWLHFGFKIQNITISSIMLYM